MRPYSFEPWTAAAVAQIEGLRIMLSTRFADQFVLLATLALALAPITAVLFQAAVV